MKRLITDHDVLTGAVGPPLVLDENTLITPSARDRAARLGWAIVEAGGRAAPAMAQGGTATDRGADRGPGCGVDRDAEPLSHGLADGVYLVRIEGGRRVAVLPAAGPGVMTRALGALPPPARRGG